MVSSIRFWEDHMQRYLISKTLSMVTQALQITERRDTIARAVRLLSIKDAIRR